MESTLINTREDLDLLAGTPAHAAAMAMLRGSLWRMEKDDVAKTWRAVQDESTVARFGLSLADFPTATTPLLPDYVLPTPAELAAAAQRAKDEADATATKAYAKLTALRGMTPAQVQAWVTANVTNLAQAQDAIATLAIAVSVLARRL